MTGEIPKREVLARRQTPPPRDCFDEVATGTAFQFPAPVPRAAGLPTAPPHSLNMSGPLPAPSPPLPLPTKVPVQPFRIRRSQRALYTIAAKVKMILYAPPTLPSTANRPRRPDTTVEWLMNATVWKRTTPHLESADNVMFPSRHTNFSTPLSFKYLEDGLWHRNMTTRQ